MKYNPHKKTLVTKKRVFYGIPAEVALNMFAASEEENFTLTVLKQTSDKQKSFLKRKAAEKQRREVERQFKTSPYGKRTTNFNKTLGA